MTIQKLHDITAELIAQKQGDADVAINFSSFLENEDGNILTVESAKFEQVQGADSSGPMGPKFPFLILDGGSK